LSAREPTSVAPSARAARLSLTLLLTIGLFLWPQFSPPSVINGDTSWLIHVVERLMAGATAYVDVVETNPPMAFLIYWPAVAAARLLGLPPEVAVYWFTGLVGVIAGVLTLAILRVSVRLTPMGLAIMAVALVVALGLVPSRSLTQREHLALLLLLPAMMSLAARAEGGTVALPIALMAGVFAGLGTSIKPHFVLAVALPALAVAAFRRDWRLLFCAEALTAAVIFIGYVGIWVLVFPAFFDQPLFLVQNTYRLYVYRWYEYLQDTPAIIFLFVLAMVGAIAWLLRRHKAVLTLALGLAAFAIAFVEQGKGFAYHLYPVAAMGLLIVALAIALGRPEQSRDLPALRGSLFLLAVGVSVVLSAFYSARFPDSSELRRALLAEKANPSIIIMSFDISVNFPLVRDIGATWASRLQSTWIGNSGHTALTRNPTPEQRDRTLRAIEIERDWLAEDIARNRPDILVFDQQITLGRMVEGASFRAVFEGRYTPGPVVQGGRFLIFRRIGS
jgi:hypothetical protein